MSHRPNQPSLTRRAYLTAGSLSMTGILSMLSGCNTLLEEIQSSTSDSDTPTPTASDPTPTAEPTPTDAPTMIPTPTATKTQTATTTMIERGTPSGQGFVRIDSSQLQTYSNPVYNYRIKYPAGWIVNDSQPDDVSIDSVEGRASIDIYVGNVGPSASVDRQIASISSALKNDYPEYRTVGRRDITLPRGQSATALDFVVGYPAGITAHGKLCITIVNGRIYMVLVLVLKENYPSIKTALNTIVESLTITV